MKFSKVIPFFAIIFLLVVSVFSTNATAQNVEDKPNDFLSLIAGNSLEGFWQLNINESNDPIKQIQTLIQKSNNSDKDMSAQQTEIPGVSISIIPPERLVLIGDKDEFTINEFYPDVVSTRTIITDGIPHIYQSNNSSIVVNAAGEKNKMSIDTISPRGNHMTETFELYADGSKLKVFIQISDSNLQKLLTLHRTYDRAILDDFSDYNQF